MRTIIRLVERALGRPVLPRMRLHRACRLPRRLRMGDTQPLHSMRRMKTYRVNVHSHGVATIKAETKAAAARRARAGDFDSYELQKPSSAITSLGEGQPIATGLQPIKQPIVFRSKR